MCDGGAVDGVDTSEGMVDGDFDGGSTWLSGASERVDGMGVDVTVTVSDSATGADGAPSLGVAATA